MKNSKAGITLVELMIAIGILTFVIVSMIQLYIYTSVQAELAGNKTLAVSEAQSKIEEMRNHNYDLIAEDYGDGGTPGNTFDLSYLNGKGLISIDSTDPELLVLQVSIFWRDKYDRIVGEDLNLNGALDEDEGEDANENDRLDAVVELISMITRR